jgi:subtilisin family serine protease
VLLHSRLRGQFSERNTPAAVLDLVRLTPVMARTAGRPEVLIALIDGPVAMNHPELEAGNIRALSGSFPAACSLAGSTACIHGTFVAGILSAKRGSAAPGIAPDCTLLVRPIFTEGQPIHGDMPSAVPLELAAAIVDCVKAGARVLNLSAALAQPCAKGERQLQLAFDFAASHGVITVAAAGNQGVLGSSAITRHPWVIPVGACDLRGRVIGQSNLGASIGRRGLIAPGENITSLSPNGESRAFGGTSAAAPFVTGTIALLWSAVPAAAAVEVKSALVLAGGARRSSVVPPVLDASAAFQTLIALRAGR